MYCGDIGPPLQAEHIVPFGLGGPWVLVEASCHKCAGITSAFERDVLRSTLMASRAALNLPTRRKHQRPTKFPLGVTRDGHEEVIEVPINKHLAAIVLPIFGPPAYLDGRPYDKGIEVNDALLVQVGGPTLDELSQMHGTKTMTIEIAWHGNSFERMLAKIALGFAVARFGCNNLADKYVVPAILGERDDVGRWVGCTKNRLFENRRFLHNIDITAVDGEVVARINLFAMFNAPEYLVVVGRLSKSYFELGHN